MTGNYGESHGESRGHLDRRSRRSVSPVLAVWWSSVCGPGQILFAVIAGIMDDVFGVLIVCLALMWLAIGVYVLATGRVPARGWFLAGWRRYRPRKAGLAMLGFGLVLGVLGADRLNHGRWDLAVLAMLLSVLLAIFVGWLVVTWKRANQV